MYKGRDMGGDAVSRRWRTGGGHMTVGVSSRSSGGPRRTGSEGGGRRGAGRGGSGIGNVNVIGNMSASASMGREL